MVKIPAKVSTRLTKETRKFQNILQQAKDRDINESDTVSIITDILSDVFGYDKYTEVTSEYEIRGTYCDLALKVNSEVHFLIEVKAIGTSLKDNHLRQALQYAATEGIQWVILTNGQSWQIYHVLFQQPVTHELICEFNFLTINSRTGEDQKKLFLLCREGIQKAAIEHFHAHRQAINRFTLGALIQSPVILKVLRREVRRMEDVQVTVEEIGSIIRSEVLKRDITDSDEAREAIRKIKRMTAKQQATKKNNTPTETPDT